MITIFGTTYFTIGAGFVVLALAAPFLFWFARWLWRPNVEDKPRRVRWLASGGTTFGLLLLLAVGLFWDVYLIGQRAKELCRETGLVVTRRISTNCLAGLTSIQSYRSLGLEFVEDDVNGKRYRFSVRNGTPYREPISNFVSQYQLVSAVERPSAEGGAIDRSFMHHVERIVDRATGDTAGILKETSIHAGWLDKLVFNLTGFTYTPWTCGRKHDGMLVVGPERMTHQALVNAVIRAPTDPRRDRNGHQDSLHESAAR